MVESAKDAPQWEMPHITSNRHPTNTHEQSHQHIYRVVVQEAYTTLDAATGLITPLVWRGSGSRHKDLSSISQSIGYQERREALLSSRPCLQPPFLSSHQSRWPGAIRREHYPEDFQDHPIA